MERLRNSLPDLEETFGVDSSMYLEATAELDHHQRTLRGAKPYKTHRTILERKVEKLRKQQSRDKDRLTELHDAAEEIRVKITATAAAVAERDKELEAAEAELKELLLKAVGEDSVPPATAPDPTQSWDNVVGAVAQLVKAPGVPQEFTCQLEGVFNQLRSMVTALQTHATAVGAPCGAVQATTEAATVPPSCYIEEEVVPPLPAADAEQLREQQATARRQRQQTVQTAHINRFISSYRAEQSGRAGGAIVDSGPKPNAAAPPEGNGSAGSEPNQATVSNSSSSSGSNPTPATGGEANGQQADAAAAAAAAAAASTSAEAAAAATVRQETGGNTGHISDINDEESDGGNLTEQEDMQVEAIVARLPAEHKNSLRAMLSVRKELLARRTQRHKKPAVDEGRTAT